MTSGLKALNQTAYKKRHEGGTARFGERHAKLLSRRTGAPTWGDFSVTLVTNHSNYVSLRRLRRR